MQGLTLEELKAKQRDWATLLTKEKQHFEDAASEMKLRHERQMSEYRDHGFYRDPWNFERPVERSSGQSTD